MKKMVFVLVILVGAMFFASGNAFARLVTTYDTPPSSSSSSSSDTSVVDLSDKDTSKPVKLLR